MTDNKGSSLLYVFHVPGTVLSPVHFIFLNMQKNPVIHHFTDEGPESQRILAYSQMQCQGPALETLMLPHLPLQALPPQLPVPSQTIAVNLQRRRTWERVCYSQQDTNLDSNFGKGNMVSTISLEEYALKHQVTINISYPEACL